MSTTTPRPRLVNVFLRGAADGLSLFAPIGDPTYHRARPTQALAAGAALDVGIDGFGLHPGAPRIAELVRSGHVALIPAAGYDSQTRSHFESQAILETAVDSHGKVDRVTGTGWLGELLEAKAASTAAPFRGVAVGSVSVPLSLFGTADTLGAPDPSALRLGALRPARNRRGTYQVLDSELIPDSVAARHAWDASHDAPRVAIGGVDAAVSVLDELGRHPIDSGDASPYGNGPAAATFAAAGAILDAGLGTEVVQIDLGGWDTHHDQGTEKGRLADLVAGLDAGLGALFQTHTDRDGGVVIAVMTEFGRRVQENASGGTDHGHGGVALVVGNGVAGGMRGSWPGLEDLDNGDVQAVNDLRVVQSEIAAHVFGAATPTLHGAKPLGIFAA